MCWPWERPIGGVALASQPDSAAAVIFRALLLPHFSVDRLGSAAVVIVTFGFRYMPGAAAWEGSADLVPRPFCAAPVPGRIRPGMRLAANCLSARPCPSVALVTAGSRPGPGAVRAEC